MRKPETTSDIHLPTLYFQIKFILIVDATNTSLRDNEIRQMFRKLHTAYTQLLSNPFYVPGDQIRSKKFDQMVTTLVQPQSGVKH
jgi:hypothetical protein